MVTTEKTTKKRQSTKGTVKKTVASKGRKKSKPTLAFENYKQALEYLFTKTDYEKQRKLRYNVTTFNLDRMKKLLKLVGNPQDKFQTAHIAGTKGKGSTATMLARMLESNGYKTGLYTSPHVMTLHERIKVNSQEITEDEFLAIMNRLAAPIEKLAKNEDSATFFEIMTAIAFMHFADMQIDIAVIETGLGGRLDSTNVIKPSVVGITSISIDHQLQLGSTLDKIAMEKAGIIKKGIPAVTVQQQPEAIDVIRDYAFSVKAPLSVTGEDIDFSYRFEYSSEHGPHTRICLTTPTSKFEHLKVPLPGEHQAINCGLALAMLDKLKSVGMQIDDTKAIDGLKNISLPGRMEMIYKDPRIMVDAAHNAASIKTLIAAIGQHVPYDSMVVIFGCGADKDVRGMLYELQFGADKVIFTKSNSPRAMLPEDLAEMYTDICGKMCQTSINLSDALRISQSALTREDLICITGSFYLVGQAKQRLMQTN